ncbi:MAG: hypothetical protein J5680_05670 [Neisseriaceae bacterium]|nr:hypothetical protein [Neisseriaceae bacterium]
MDCGNQFGFGGKVVRTAVGWANRQTGESVYRRRVCRCEPDDSQAWQSLAHAF